LANNIVKKFTLNPSSPGFSGSKSYRAVQHGVLWAIGVLAGDLLGEGKGEAENSRHECAKLLEVALNW